MNDKNVNTVRSTQTSLSKRILCLILSLYFSRLKYLNIKINMFHSLMACLCTLFILQGACLEPFKEQREIQVCVFSFV